MFWLQLVALILNVFAVFASAFLAQKKRVLEPYTAFTVVRCVLTIILIWLIGGFSTFWASPLAH